MSDQQTRSGGRDADPADLPAWFLRDAPGGRDARTLVLQGDWTARSAPLEEAERAGVLLQQGSTLRLDASALGNWDSRLMAFLLDLSRHCAAKGVRVDASDLPGSVRRLIDLATAVPPASARESRVAGGLATRIGTAAIDGLDRSKEVLAFVGEVTLGLGRAISGRARIRRSDIWLQIQQCGVDALPIISLVSFLVGLILGFVGAVQLRQFGAEIFVADLVGIAMVRDIGGIMAAIVMAGRTGASFAAQLGSMQVNEEIDALKTFGIQPIELLVLPRLLALILMMPLLTLYADLMGMLGGGVIAMLDANLTIGEYWRELVDAVSLTDLAGGLAKSLVYGAMVAIAGCLYGMECGRSAAAVGQATTAAVVSGIVAIVVSCATLTVVYDVIGF